MNLSKKRTLKIISFYRHCLFYLMIVIFASVNKVQKVALPVHKKSLTENLDFVLSALLIHFIFIHCRFRAFTLWSLNEVYIIQNMRRWRSERKICSPKKLLLILESELQKDIYKMNIALSLYTSIHIQNRRYTVYNL